MRYVLRLCALRAVSAGSCALFAGGREGCAEVMRCVLLCMLEAVDGELYLLEVLEMICRALLCMLEVVEDELCLLEALEVSEVMRCVPLCTLEGGFYLQEVLEVLKAPEVLVRGALCASLYAGGRRG